MISDFIKSRFENKNQPLTARLVFGETRKEVPKTVYSYDEREKKGIIKNDYCEDIQKYLYSRSTEKEFNLKKPSKWFGAVEGKKGTDAKKSVQENINNTYETIFDKNGPLKKQLVEYRKIYGGNKTVEEMVFGSTVVDSVAKDNSKLKKRPTGVELKKMEQAEKSVRLKAIAIRLENAKRSKEKKEQTDIVKKLGDGVSNISESFRENLSDGKYVEAGLQAVGMYLLLRSAWALIKKKPADESMTAYLGKNILKAAIGVGILMPDATRGKENLLYTTGLLNYSDKMPPGGLADLMRGLEWKTRTKGEAINALAEIDIGDIHREYEIACAEGRYEIDPKKLLRDKAPKKSILNGKEFFHIVEAILERYGAKYYAAVSEDGKPPEDRLEMQAGIELFIRWHKKTANQSKSFGNVVAREEAAFAQWEKGVFPHGKLSNLWEVAKSVGTAIIHPTQIPEEFSNIVDQWVTLFGGDPEWFDANVSDPLKKNIAGIYETDKKLAKQLVGVITKFSSEQWGEFMKDREGYITDVTTNGVKFGLNLAGATIMGIYNIAAGTTRVTLNVGGEVYKNVETNVLTEGTTANKIIFTKWMPYEYDVEKKEWKKASISEGLGVPEMYANAEEFWENYFKKTLPKQWKDNIQPMLDRSGITCGYELFADFTKAIAEEGIIPAGKATGEGVAKFFTNENNIILAFARAAKDKGVETWGDFKDLNVSVAAFLAEYAEEVKNKEANIKEFEAVISNSAAEKKYFDVAVKKTKLAEDDKFPQSLDLFNKEKRSIFVDKKVNPQIKALKNFSKQEVKLAELEPKVRAWMFEQLGWLHLDMNSSLAESDFDARTGLGFIEYKDIALDGTVPLVGNKKCKLKINFSQTGQLPIDKKRFELTPEGGTTLPLESADFRNYEQLYKKIDFDKAKKSLGDNGNGKITLAGRVLERVDVNGGLSVSDKINWLDENQFYKYKYVASAGYIVTVGIPIDSREKFYIEIDGDKSVFNNTESLKSKAAEIFENIDKKITGEVLSRKKKVDSLRLQLGDNGESYFKVGRHQLTALSPNGGIKQDIDWLKPETYFTYKCSDAGNEYFVKILTHPEKSKILVLDGSNMVLLNTNVPNEVRKFMKGIFEKKIRTKIEDTELFHPPEDVYPGQEGFLQITEIPLDTNYFFIPANGATIEKVVVSHKTGGKTMVLSSEITDELIEVEIKEGRLHYRVGEKIKEGKYVVQIDLKMSGHRQSLSWGVDVISKKNDKGKSR